LKRLTRDKHSTLLETFKKPGIKKCHTIGIQIYDSSKDDPSHGILGNGIPKMIDLYRTFMNFSESYTWDIDQV
jgi:hypothetical protein